MTKKEQDEINDALRQAIHQIFESSPLGKEYIEDLANKVVEKTKEQRRTKEDGKD